MRIDYLKYKHGLIAKKSDRRKLKAHHLTSREIPEKLHELIERNAIIDLNGAFGVKEGADPVEYDELKIKMGDRIANIEVYNKGISMVLAETPELKRIFQVCCQLRDQCVT